MKIPEWNRDDKAGPVPVLTVDARCSLQGAPEELKAAIRLALTMDNPKYQAAKRYGRWVGRQLKPTLKFYQTQGEALCFPRGFANQAVLLCRRMIGSGPRIVDRRRRLEPIELEFSGSLRPYQQDAVEAVDHHSFGVLEAGTGSGKTVMALALMARRRQPTLVLVHSKELLFQWQERIQQFLGITPGQAGDGVLAPQPITVGIVNTVRKHLESLGPLFGQLIVDECHRVPASLFTEVVAAFDGVYMLGLSATAFRREDSMTRLIYIYMGDRVHRVDPSELAASGAVTLPELVQHQTGFSYRFRGEYGPMLKALVNDQARNTQIVEDVAELLSRGHSGTVLLVSDRVAHCELLAEQLGARGIRVALLTGQLAKEQRSQVVDDLLHGRLEVLIATLQLIGEGFDCQGLTTLVLATPIKFEGRLLQVVGRIMRPAPGKKALVIDYVDVQVPLLHRSALEREQLFSRW
ncbi:DEAD/DEAH box helicase [Desulfogranum mediterraneum]|uniref:DEAD/DEAH box helicase n=1 Tax=Desulfogranum mediterraneum TaxID=160661 RepID=UPI001E6024B6|nr:DEAD/DEAH box helicase [Desulfogranum mediterraneum]